MDKIFIKLLNNSDAKEIILDLLHDIWTLEIIPTESKLARVVTIYKKGNPDLPANYRPISLINTVVKLYELTILKAITNRNEIISATQFGAMKGRSSLLQYEQLISAIEERLSHKEESWLLLVDFSKAFDSVNREIMLQKLAICGIPTHILNAIRLT